MSIIRAKELVHEYIRRDEEGNVEAIQVALDHVNLNVEPGQFISILGHNDSGKSTFAKHINALLTPSEGTLYVDGMNVSDDEYTFAVRQTAGMVFQNPDNQIIASVVDADVAFGPENIGVPTEQIITRVEKALKMVGMYKYKSHSPNKLSGGQKQRLSIARSIIGHHDFYLFDDCFSALDMNTERKIKDNLKSLETSSVLIVSQRISTIMDADEILVIDNGEIVDRGTHESLVENCEIYREIANTQIDSMEAML